MVDLELDWSKPAILARRERKSGAHRNILRLVPPMCLQLADVEQVAQALERCFEGF